MPALALLNGKPYCRTHKRFAPEGRKSCVLCESERELEIAARNPITTPTYTGPDRRRQGLCECEKCKRHLRPQYFSNPDPHYSVYERPGICDDCDRARIAQRAAEISRAQTPARRGRVTKDVFRDKDGNIERIVVSDESGNATVEEIKTVDVGVAAAERSSPEQLGGVEREHKVFHTRQEGDKTILEGADITRWRTTDDMVPRRVLKEEATRSAQAQVDEFFKRHPVVPLGPTPAGMSAIDYIERVHAALADNASLSGAEYVLVRLPERGATSPSPASSSSPAAISSGETSFNEWGPLLGWIDQFLAKQPPVGAEEPYVRIAKVPVGKDAAAFLKGLIADGDEWTSFKRSADGRSEYVVF